jgi:hypothetical protein
MDTTFLDELQVDELDALIEDSMYEIDEDWESIRETDIDDWSFVEYQ